MTAVQIRLAADDEYERIDEFIRSAYEHDYGPREHGDDPMRLARNRAQAYDVWVAVDAEKGEILGSVTTASAGGSPLMEDAGPEDLTFRLLAVAPQARRRGLGAALTRHVIELARERGIPRVFLKSAPQMTGAHALYLATGFHRDPERDGLWIDGRKVLELHAFLVDIDTIPSLQENHA
ncbi:GNAT family N-acetyltransferase [Microbacterium sp. MYb66]|uniref:GNAT family N-acetyltransferase n=1 Tax=Microbacterium sp. MYb66 TaxID=1848692 RepID=UPI000D000439|nr:GNAT family N-acetyltransferase [Microbacterium sp. MYb66]PRA81872.1 GNAT family N-acetyltransferase [Microbacterium sp. MYb66]